MSSFFSVNHRQLQNFKELVSGYPYSVYRATRGRALTSSVNPVLSPCRFKTRPRKQACATTIPPPGGSFPPPPENAPVGSSGNTTTVGTFLASCCVRCYCSERHTSSPHQEIGTFPVQRHAPLFSMSTSSYRACASASRPHYLHVT